MISLPYDQSSIDCHIRQLSKKTILEINFKISKMIRKRKLETIINYYEKCR